MRVACSASICLVNDRPRIHEDHLDVEQDEQHGHEVELHGEARAALADGVACRIRRRCPWPGAFAELAEQDGDDQRPAREPDGGGEQKQHRNVLSQLRVISMRGNLRMTGAICNCKRGRRLG